MRIVVDLQACQSLSHRNRGIARYAMAFTQALLRCAGSDEIWVTLNGLIDDTVEPLRAALAGLIDEQRVVVWESIAHTACSDPANRWRHSAAERIREAFLAQLRPDVVYVSSLFEGYLDEVVTAVGRDLPYATAVALYDLIPLRHADVYLSDPKMRDWYAGRLDELKRADLLLGISRHTCREATDLLGIPADRLTNVRAAADSRFVSATVEPDRARRLLSKLGISRRFLMYTGGFDYRKNMDGLVRAYATLPGELRRTCQLVLVCQASSAARGSLLDLGRELGLGNDELILTGHVGDDDLVDLYNLCYALVFPSLSEGFGLPVLEAMSCGTAVIGSGTSSIPEILAREDALFDPRDGVAMARKMQHVLTDTAFRESLRQYGLQQAKQFSWDDCARRALGAMRDACARHSDANRIAMPVARPSLQAKPSLAFVSPLPPERSGVADYSAELLPALADYYQIEAISDQPRLADSWLCEHVPLRSYAWFEQHADEYDRVLYHIGNGILHADMLGMLQRHPGTVVLHEVFLSGLASHLELASKVPGYWTRSLYESHGYPGLLDRSVTEDPERILERYPCSIAVIRDADGIIVHSEFCRELADAWFGLGTSRDWAVIPLVRRLPPTRDRRDARDRLGISDKDWLVCCFGILSSYKCNRAVIQGWLASDLANRPECRLVFVGAAHDEAYASELKTLIAEHNVRARVEITGWVDRNTYHDYLAAADCAVQMRRASRGETSGTVLDCLAYGIPTIVNAHGAFNELPSDGVLRINDEFAISDLAQALNVLVADLHLCNRLRKNAREYCAATFDPERIARLYNDAIESAPDSPRRAAAKFARTIALLDSTPGSGSGLDDFGNLTVAFAANMRRRAGKKQLLVDISELVRRDARSGIQRVVKNVLDVLLRHPPDEFRVEPVYADAGQRYCYARSFTARFLDLAEALPVDEPIDVDSGDVFLGLDLALEEIPANQRELGSMHRRGVKIFFVVYDQLPLRRADCFPPHAYHLFNSWMSVLAGISDGLVCISRAVEEELRIHLDSLQVPRAHGLALGHFHLGADVALDESCVGITQLHQTFLERLRRAPTFLMVGTIEPRKGHAQALDAFDRLWSDGNQAILVLVGKQGWMTEDLVHRIRDHFQNGSRLFWFDRADDELLLNLYTACSALLAPSEGEGFGLPLIEAAKHGLPILCRDLPVFREVAGEHASYFTGFSGSDLARAIRDWLALSKCGNVPSSRQITWSSWEQSTQMLLDVVLGGNWDGRWTPGERYWFTAYDARAEIKGGRRERHGVLLVGDEGGCLQTSVLEVARGCYRLQIQGCWSDGHGGGRIEVMVHGESAMVASFSFSAANANLHAGLFESPAFISDGTTLMLRINVSKGSSFWIDGCILEQAGAEALPGIAGQFPNPKQAGVVGHDKGFVVHSDQATR